MKKTLLVSALSLALGSCAMMYAPMSYTLAKQPAGGALNSSGNVTVKRDGMTVMTNAMVSGLAPNTYYVAHYHVQGTARDRKSTRLNSSHTDISRMPSSA